MDRPMRAGRIAIAGLRDAGVHQLHRVRCASLRTAAGLGNGFLRSGCFSHRRYSCGLRQAVTAAVAGDAVRRLAINTSWW